MPTVVGLLLSSSPADIAWFVAKGVVDSVDAVFWGGLGTDVGVEGGEVVSPFIADEDAANAVIGIFGIGGVMAALLHRAPVAVFRAMALPVGCDQVGHLLNAMAAAGFDRAFAEVIGVNDLPGTAIAMAMPMGMSVVDGVGDRSGCDGDELVKALVGEVV